MIKPNRGQSVCFVDTIRKKIDKKKKKKKKEKKEKEKKKKKVRQELCKNKARVERARQRLETGEGGRKGGREEGRKGRRDENKTDQQKQEKILQQTNIETARGVVSWEVVWGRWRRQAQVARHRLQVSRFRWFFLLTQRLQVSGFRWFFLLTKREP